MPTILLVVLGLVVVVLAAYFFVRAKFRATTEARWALPIQSQVLEWDRRLAVIARGPVSKVDEARLKAEHFTRHLQSISLDVLQDHTGIGPGTVDRLRSAGLNTFPECLRYNFDRIPGIGPVKDGDLRRAVAEVHKQAEARFNAGSCPEADEFRRIMADDKAAMAREQSAMLREKSAIERARQSGQVAIQAASQITLWKYLTAGFKFPGFDPMMLTQSLAPMRIEEEPEVPVVKPTPPPVVVSGKAAAKPSAGPSVLPPAVPITLPPVAAKPSGDLFERELGKAASTTSTASTGPAGLPKLRAFCGFAMMVAKADGRVAKSERDVMRRGLGDFFGSDPALLRHLDPTLESLEGNAPSEADAVAMVLANSTESERKKLLEMAERIADAAGERNVREHECIDRVTVAFGLSAPVVAVPPTPVAPPTTDPRTVLEIEPGVSLSVELIRRRYNFLTDKADPVKAAAMGPEFVKLVEEKRRAVRAAAEALIAPFGEALDKPAPEAPKDMRENSMLDDVFGM
jgi:uncharacterized tellurite resistance protein B-like protein